MEVQLRPRNLRRTRLARSSDRRLTNRTVDHARRWADGFPYVTPGAEPGCFPACPHTTRADLENWAAALVGDDILYNAHNVTAGEGVNVLMITVDPPKDGDIHSL